MPVSTALVAGYLTNLAEERRLSVDTIRLHKAVLAAAHKALAAVKATANSRRWLGANPKCQSFGNTSQ